MTYHQITLSPRDVLFFCDGRPIAGSQTGIGSAWPLPSVFHSALLSALRTNFEDSIQDLESKHEHLKDKEKTKSTQFHFGDLKTIGPFPCKNGKLFFPTPADLELYNKKSVYMQPTRFTIGETNLPEGLIYTVSSSRPATKEKTAPWIDEDNLKKYLEGKDDVKTTSASDLFLTERRVGIAINDDTGTAEKGQLYSAEYLRLRSGVSMRTFAECEAKKYGGASTADLLQKLFDENHENALLFGGQRGVAYLEADVQKLALPQGKISSSLKWTLLSPAIFCNGWKPDFLDANGNVMLKEDVQRKPGEAREAWRQRIAKAPSIHARLVAACVQKPLVKSGWDIANNTPKRTSLLVPAGSVFYFQCDNDEQARLLFEALNAKCHSSSLAEQGFGLGVCSSWNLRTI